MAEPDVLKLDTEMNVDTTYTAPEATYTVDEAAFAGGRGLDPATQGVFETVFEYAPIATAFGLGLKGPQILRAAKNQAPKLWNRVKNLLKKPKSTLTKAEKKEIRLFEKDMKRVDDEMLQFKKQNVEKEMIFKSQQDFANFAELQRRSIMGDAASKKAVDKFVESVSSRPFSVEYTAKGLMKRGMEEGRVARKMGLPEWRTPIQQAQVDAQGVGEKIAYRNYLNNFRNMPVSKAYKQGTPAGTKPPFTVGNMISDDALGHMQDIASNKMIWPSIATIFGTYEGVKHLTTDPKDPSGGEWYPPQALPSPYEPGMSQTDSLIENMEGMVPMDMTPAPKFDPMSIIQNMTSEDEIF